MKQKYKNNGINYLIKIAYRNLFRNLRRSILCIIAVSLAVLLIVFLMAYIEGMLDSAKKIAQTFISGHIKISTKGFEEKEVFYPLQYPIDNLDLFIDKIKDINGIKAIDPRITSYATFTNSNVKHGIVAGVNFKEIQKMKDEKIKYAFYNFTKKSDGLLIGRFPFDDENECAMGYRMAKKMEIIPKILEKYEFEWILDNISLDDNKKFLKDSYKFDNSSMTYNLNIFKKNNDDNIENKIAGKKIKKSLATEKSSYLRLLDIFMNLQIINIPDIIGINANILDYIFLINYQKELFLKIYTFDKDHNYYTHNENIKITDKEELLNILNSGMALRIPFKILSSQYSDKYYQPKLVGIFEFDYVDVDQNYILIPFNKMQRLGTLKNKTQNILVFVKNMNQLKKIKEEIISKIDNPDIIVKDWTETPFIAAFRQFEFVYFIIYSVFLIVASFLIINTIIMVIHERIKEIGMMGALGMNRKEIVLLFFLEALLLSIFGALAGTLMGGITTGIWSLFPINIETLTGGVEFPVTNTIFIKFSLIILIKGFIFGTIVTSICTILPSLKSAFIEPVEALRR